MIITIWFI